MKNLRITFCCLSFFLVVLCCKSPGPEKEKSSDFRKISFNDKNGYNTGDIHFQNGAVTIHSKNAILRLKIKNGKRMYVNENNDCVYTLKMKSDGFKLRNCRGDLLWKIKEKEGKIKISDNEENRDPYEIKLKEGDRIKLVHLNQEIGKMKNKDGKIIIQSDFQEYVVKSPDFHPSLSFICVDEIDILTRLTIIAEIIENISLQ